MDTKKKIDDDLKKAMKEHDDFVCSLLRMLKTAIKNAEIEKKQELEQQDVLIILEKQAKQRRDSISQFEKGGRNDLAQKEKKELEIVKSYLPEKLGEDEVRKEIQAVIDQVKPEGISDFGKVMGVCMQKLKGKADGSLVNKIVKEEISKR